MSAQRKRLPQDVRDLRQEIARLSKALRLIVAIGEHRHTLNVDRSMWNIAKRALLGCKEP